MVIGVDIGGSHFMAAIIDKNVPNTAQDIYKMEIRCDDTRENVLSSWVSVLRMAINKLKNKKLEGIGVAIPGPFDYYNGIFPNQGQSKFEALYDINLKEYLVKELQIDPLVPIRFYNDAACFGIGEAWVGTLSGYKKCVAITLGTGLGATFLDDETPLKQGAGVPKDGELYHLPFKEDIADTYFSTQWFQRRYQEISGDEIKGVKELIMDCQNEEITTIIFKEFAQNLAIFLAPWLSEFEAEALVIGGNISKAWTFFEKDLQAALNSFQIHIPVHKSNLLEHAALIGSAKIIDDEFYDVLLNV